MGAAMPEAMGTHSGKQCAGVPDTYVQPMGATVEICVDAYCEDPACPDEICQHRPRWELWVLEVVSAEGQARVVSTADIAWPACRLRCAPRAGQIDRLFLNFTRTPPTTTVH